MVTVHSSDQWYDVIHTHLKINGCNLKSTQLKRNLIFHRKGTSSSIHLHFFGSMENFQGSWKKVLPNQHFWGSKKVVSRQDGWNPSGQNCWWIFFRNPSSFTMKSFSPFFTSWILQNLRSFLLVSRIFFNISTNTTVSTVTYQNQKMIHGSFKLKLYMSPDFWDYFKRKGHEPSSNQPSIFR